MSKKSRRKAAVRAGTASKPQPAPKGRRPNPNRRQLGFWLGGLAVLLAITATVVLVNQQPSSNPSNNASLLADTSGMAQGQPVDGISCQTSEQIVYHIHAHLAVYTNGKARTIPEGIGIVPPTQVVQTSAGPFVVAGTCFYWLHSHTADGIVHIASPSQRVYALGDYLDIWNQTLIATQVGPVHGTVTAYVDGQPFTGDPRSIPLNPHTLIQLDVGSASPGPQPFTFPPGL